MKFFSLAIMLSTSLLPLTVLGSCVAEDGTVTPEGIAQLHQADTSGTRIERWKSVFTKRLADGTLIDQEAYYTLHDTKYDWDCMIQTATDRAYRCLPGDLNSQLVPVVFNDTRCTKPIKYDRSPEVSMKYIKDSEGDIRLALGEILPLPAVYYAMQAGMCTKVTPPAMPWPYHAVTIGPKISPRDFVEMVTIDVVRTKL